MIGLNDMLWCVVGVGAVAIFVLVMVCYGVHEPGVNPSETEDVRLYPSAEAARLYEDNPEWFEEPPCTK